MVCVVCYYGTDDKLWIQCSGCDSWFHPECVNVNNENIPDVFLCMDVIVESFLLLFHNPLLCFIITYVTQGMLCNVCKTPWFLGFWWKWKVNGS